MGSGLEAAKAGLAMEEGGLAAERATGLAAGMIGCGGSMLTGEDGAAVIAASHAPESAALFAGTWKG